MKKRSVTILGHATSVTLEEEFWDALKAEAARDNLSINALIAHIDAQRLKDNPNANLSSAVRVHILRRLQTDISAANY